IRWATCCWRQTSAPQALSLRLGAFGEDLEEVAEGGEGDIGRGDVVGEGGLLPADPGGAAAGVGGAGDVREGAVADVEDLLGGDGEALRERLEDRAVRLGRAQGL